MSELSRQFNEIFAKLRALTIVGTPLRVHPCKNFEDLNRVTGTFCDQIERNFEWISVRFHNIERFS
jgi:hypothetical protein